MSERDKVKIDHVNSQSIMANKDEIDLLIKERNTDILCVSETWLSPETPDEHIAISNYNIFRCDRGRGGGVCIYVRDVYNYSCTLRRSKTTRCGGRVGGSPEV